MIALNKSMPQTCFECPCLQTYAIEDEYYPDIQHLLRHCAAKGMTMVTIPWQAGTTVPEDWTDWPVPEWCPWIEIKK